MQATNHRSEIKNNHRARGWRALIAAIVITIAGLLPANSYAHQTPGTIVLLDVSPGQVSMELQLPLSELSLSFGQDVKKDPETLIASVGPQLKEYLAAHIHAFTIRENPWMVTVERMRVDKGEQILSGPPFWELNVQVLLQPPVNVSTRNFTLDYDVIMHQVINHTALVSVRNDWENGKADGALAEAGVIHRDMKDNIIYPLQINLEKGSWWNGFKTMVALGMQHIKEGTDHLLFLLTLLLPAMLLVTKNNRWGKFGGITYSISRLLKIVTAFTVGHSLTLLIGALGWVRLPAQPVEILIAVSILVSAVHAIYPLFAGREMYVAGGFGLIHGLAFASVLSNLNLNAGPMALSIAGFNLGIELMQIFVVAIIIPWLVLLSKTNYYKYIRIVGAIISGVAAIAWIAERSSGSTNIIGNFILRLSQYNVWGVICLALMSVVFYQLNKRRNPVLQKD